MIFYFGFRGFIDIATPPGNSYEIQVHAQRWKWTFTYPNGYVDENLHVPVDRPVRLMMTSEDVIHAFFVPDFRIKRDVVPGRYNMTWFRATQAGHARSLLRGVLRDEPLPHVCAGDRPSAGRVREVARDVRRRDRQAASRGGGPASVQDARLRAVPLDRRQGRDRADVQGPASDTRCPSKDGKTVVADENYIRESILDPQAQVVAGFEPVMPTYQGRLKDRRSR